LIEAQHHYHGKVLAMTHVHLDARNCLEVIIVKGRGTEVQELADHILSLRGVKHGKLVMTTTGTRLK
jgi:CopG family nickel-responsive transcriptional regulator